MKAKSILIVVGMVLMFGSDRGHALTNFHDDAVIQEGDIYDYVHVYDDATVDMTGGIVTHLTGWDYSTINVSGGILGGLGSLEFSMLNLYYDAVVGSVGVSDSGTLNMFGGNVDVIMVGSTKIVNLYGGIISDYLMATSTVNVYGYDFQYNPLAGDYRGGQLTGFWLDDTPFSIDLFGDPGGPGGAPIDTYSHIVLIPEPATILLFGLGSLILERNFHLT